MKNSAFALALALALALAYYATLNPNQSAFQAPLSQIMSNERSNQMDGQLDNCVQRPSLKSRVTTRVSFSFLYIFIMSSAMAILFVGWSYYRFGSIFAGIDYLEGKRIVVDAPNQDLGIVSPGQTRTIAYHLTNYTGHDIKVLNVSTSCSCAILGEELQMIRSSGGANLHVTVTMPDRRSILNGEIILLTDEPRDPQIRLQYRVRVEPAS